MNLRRLEEAALNAWPSLQQMLYDGWLLRFADGYTKRANSVNPLYPSNSDLVDHVAACERAYAARGLPPIFRLTPFAPPELDGLLAERGYRVLEPTLVMRRSLEGFQLQAATGERLAGLPLDEWLAHYHRMRGTPHSAAHRAMLQAIPGETSCAALMAGGDVVACGLGVVEDDLFGIFDVVSDPVLRRRGYGKGLMNGLLGWGLAHGGREAYLQVVEADEPARRLYAGFGFEEAYRYWYRVR